MATRSRIKAERVACAVVTVIGLVVLALVLWSVHSVWRVFSGEGGGEVVVVPSVIGMSEEDAVRALDASGLVPRVVRRMHNDTQPVGFVFKQQREYPDKVRQGTRVSLWVSLGKASFIVPDLVGLQYGEVPAKLASAGLVMGAPRKIYRADMTAGEVVNQDPSAGREYQSAVAVDVVVADNRNLPRQEVPEVIGHRLALAEDLLARSNLHLTAVQYLADDTVPAGTVVAQSVTPGEQVQLGSSVELRVALPREVIEHPTKSVTVRLPVPHGPEQQRVKIKVFDKLAPGGSVAYDQVHEPGYTVEQRLSPEGKATVFVFINDMEHPFRSESL